MFTTTHGASEDLLNEGFRRMLVNARCGPPDSSRRLPPTGNIAFVGPFAPTTFNFNGFVQGDEAIGPGGLGLADSEEVERVETA